MPRFRRLALGLALGLPLFPVAAQADGLPDTKWGGGDGILTVVFDPAPAASGRTTAGLVDAVGRYVAAGSYRTPGVPGGRAFVLRMLPNGQRDGNFGGGDGLVLFDTPAGYRDYTPERILELEDGSLLLAGQLDPDVDGGVPRLVRVCKLNPASIPDPGFGAGGCANHALGSPFGAFYRDMTVDAAGRVLLYGRAMTDGSGTAFEVAVARLKPDGTGDTCFGPAACPNTGVFTEASVPWNTDVPTSIAVLPNGRIVYGGRHSSNPGSSLAVVALTGGGALDLAFGDAGRTVVPREIGGYTLSLANDFAPLPDNSLLVIGEARYNANGDDFGTLVRLDPNGNPAAGFATGGRRDFFWNDVSLNNTAAAIAALPDGRFLVAGTSRAGLSPKQDNFAVGRFFADGSTDFEFAYNGSISLDGDRLGNEEVPDAAVAIGVTPEYVVVIGSSGNAADGQRPWPVFVRLERKGLFRDGFE